MCVQGARDGILFRGAVVILEADDALQTIDTAVTRKSSKGFHGRG